MKFHENLLRGMEFEMCGQTRQISGWMEEYDPLFISALSVMNV
jgi:hypothetical protein